LLPTWTEGNVPRHPKSVSISSFHFAGRLVPDDRLVRAVSLKDGARDDVPAVGAEHGMRGRVALQHPAFRTPRPVPGLYQTVRAQRQHLLTIRAKPYRTDPALVAISGNLATRCHVPEYHGVVVSGGGEPCFVRAEHWRAKPLGMPAKDVHRPAGFRIPDAYSR